jgi:hypothetical protein
MQQAGDVNWTVRPYFYVGYGAYLRGFLGEPVRAQIKRRNSMKKFIVAGALVALFVSPALAQTTHNPVHVNAKARAANASAASQAQTDNGMNGGPNGEIIWGGKVRGQDPDPFIRGSIIRGLGNWGGD